MTRLEHELSEGRVIATSQPFDFPASSASQPLRTPAIEADDALARAYAWALGPSGLSTVTLVLGIETLRSFYGGLVAEAGSVAGLVAAGLLAQALGMVGAAGNRHWGFELGRFASLLLCPLLLVASRYSRDLAPLALVGIFSLGVFAWCWARMANSTEGEPLVYRLARPMPRGPEDFLWVFFGRFRRNPHELLAKGVGWLILLIGTATLIALPHLPPRNPGLVVIPCVLLFLLAPKLVAGKAWAAAAFNILLVVFGGSIAMILTTSGDLRSIPPPLALAYLLGAYSTLWIMKRFAWLGKGALS